MKYAIFFTNMMLSFFGAICILNSCTKVPDRPSHGQPGKWLLHKIYYQPAGSSDTSKILQDEYFYNNQRRPWRHIAYSTKGDTARIDTFYYDGQQRLSIIKNRSIMANRTSFVRQQIAYLPDSRIDSIIEEISSQGATPARQVYTFSYEGLLVIANTATAYSNNFYYDSRGDLVERLEGARTEETTVDYNRKDNFSDYDTCVNVYRFLNMNVYEPMKDPMLSKHNYQLNEVNTRGNIEFGVYQQLNVVFTHEHIRDMNGLTVETIVKSSNTGTSFRLLYEYIR